MLQKCGSYVVCSYKEIMLISEVSALQKQTNRLERIIAAVHIILWKVCKKNKIEKNPCVCK